MEGFLDIRLKPWLRRLVTRLIAIVPAVVVTPATPGTAATVHISSLLPDRASRFG